MGFRKFLQGKVEKHGGVAGAAKAALTKPSRMLAGQPSRAAAPKASESAPKPSFTDLMSNLPTEPDADGLVAIGPSQLVKEEQPGTFEAPNDVTVAVFRYQDEVYAIDNTCTHEDGPLAEGTVKGNLIACPYHDWDFDFTTGACPTDPSRPVATFKVAEHDGYIWIGDALTESSKDRGGDENDGLAVKVNQTSRLP